MSYPRLAARLYNAPLLITPDKAEVLERVFRAHVEGTIAALPAFKAGERNHFDLASSSGGTVRTQGGYFRTGDGMAVIQVLGSLVQRGSIDDAASGLESYDRIGAQFGAAVNDPMVRGILLEIDSDGGEAAGCFNLASLIRTADGMKPVTAHANEKAFSAAYALGVSAGEFYVADTGMVGSVGVRMLHVDQSSYDAKRGMVYTPIFAGARKNDGSTHAPLSDEAATAAQAMCDRLYETFINHVAGMRDIDAQEVRDTEAALLHPDQAEKVRMVDGVATLDGALQSLRARVAERAETGNSFYQRAADAQIKEIHMATDNKAPAATVAAITPEQLAAERATALAEGIAQGKLEASKDTDAKATCSAVAARERIKAINMCEAAKGREKLAAHIAYDTEMSVEQAVALLGNAPQEQPAAAANPLAAAMAGLPNPKVGADGGDEDEAKSAVLFVLNAGKPRAA